MILGGIICTQRDREPNSRILHTRVPPVSSSFCLLASSGAPSSPSCRRFGITHGLPRIGNTPCLNQPDQCVPVLSLSIFDDLFTRQCARLWLPSTRGVAAERADFCLLCSRRLLHKPFSAHTLHIDCLSLTFQCFLRVLLPSAVAPCQWPPCGRRRLSPARSNPRRGPRRK